MIAFACPGCGKTFQVKDELAGRKTKCPKCGGALVVPRHSERLAPVATVLPAHPENSTTPHQEHGRNRSYTGLLIGLGVGVALFLSVLVIAVLWATGFFSTSQKEGGTPSVRQIDSFLGVSQDFKHVAVRAGSGVKVIDLESGKEALQLPWDKDWGSAHAAAFTGEKVAVMTGGSVKFFSRQTGELLQNVRGETEVAELSPDQRFLAFAEFRPGQGFHLVLHDIPKKRRIAEKDIGSNGYVALAMATSHVATYETSDDRLCIVELESGKLIRELKTRNNRREDEHFSARPALALSPDGKLVAFASEDAIKLYDLAPGQEPRTLEGHLDAVTSVAFHPNGELLASASKDKTIRLWHLKDGQQTPIVRNLASTPDRLRFSSDGKKLLTVYETERAFFDRHMRAEIRMLDLK